MDNKMEERKRIKSIEVEAASLREAIKKALKEMGVKKQDVNIEVLKEEHKGLFGMEGAKPTRIKATLKKNPLKKK